MDLTAYSIDELALELTTRKNLLDQNGMMPSWNLHQLLTLISPIPCVDGVAVRRNGAGEVEAMAIRRGTGCFAGRLCSIGGRIVRGESLEDCLRRQFRSDVGSEIELLMPWNNPVDINQNAPLEDPLNDPWPKDFGPENKKHTISCFYPVRLLSDNLSFGTTEHGGQEAGSVEWYTLETLPDAEEFGYNQRPKFVSCLELADELLDPH